jgi:hypothetical protein
VAETYTTLTAKLANTQPVVRVELAGVPWKMTGIDSGGADGDGSTAYSVRPVSVVSHTPAEYTAQQIKGYKQVLVGCRFSGERIDPVTGRTTIGRVSVEFIDPTGYFADLFAVYAFARAAKLTATLSRTATSMSVDTATTAGNAYFIGRECVVAKQSSTTPNIARGADAADARQAIHEVTTDSEAHADYVYAGPRVWTGQEINVYFGYDHADVDEDNEYGPVRFILAGPPARSAAGVWTLEGESLLRVLDKPYARGSYVGRPYGGVSRRVRGGTLDTYKLWPANDSIVSAPSTTTVGDTLYFAIGDEVVDATILTSNTGGLSVTVQHRGLFGTEPNAAAITGADEDVDKTVWREIIPTDAGLDAPRIGPVPYSAGWDIADLEASSHIVDAFLALLLSRDGSAGTNATTNEDSFDILPPPWGLAMPVARVNQGAFEAVREATPHALFPWFRLGRKAEALRKWWEREAAPYLPFALHSMTQDGISPVSIGYVYPLDGGAVTIDLGDILEPHGYELQDGIVGAYRVTHRADGGSAEIIDAVSVLAAELYPDGVDTIEHESDGANPDTRDLILDRAAAIIGRADLPAPVISLRVRWAFHLTAVPGAAITLTTQGPNIADGGYDITADPWQVLSAEMQPLGSPAHVALVLRRASENTAHYGPAARVTNYDNGTFTLDLSANEYAPTATTSDLVPTSDVAGFGANGSQGGAGLYVAVYSKRGVQLTDPAEISTISYAGPYLRFAAGLTLLGGGAYTLTSGDVVRLAPYLAAVKTLHDASSISGDQDAFAAQATVASGLVNASQAAYVWGF